MPNRQHAAAASDEKPSVKLPADPHRRLATLVTMLLLAATVAWAVLTAYRHVLSGGAAFMPADADAQTAASASGLPAAALTVDVRYISEIAETNGSASDLGIVSVPVTFDDAWFAAGADLYAYNPVLAQTAAVLCAVVNSESAFVGGKTDIDFAREALEALGFEDVSTTSFENRSAAGDEVAAIFTGGTDVTAYVLAHKALPDGRDLVFVGVRGTFGSEWISNFNVASLGTGANAGDDATDPADSAGSTTALTAEVETAQALATEANAGHRGFTTAEAEVAQALDAYCAEMGIAREGAVVFACGHSRGGAVANLLAAELDDRMACAAGDAGAPGGLVPGGVCAYTFAAPNNTQSDQASDARYGNVFNVVNPTDLVPRLPLAAWGWRRFGVTVELPGPTDAGFDDAYAAMQQRRAAITGFYNAANPFSEEEGNPVDDVEQRLAQSVPDFPSLLSIDGVTALVGALGSLNVGQVVASHYPDTYIAWLQEPEQ